MTAQVEFHEIMQIYTVVTSSVFYKYRCYVSSNSFKIGHSVKNKNIATNDDEQNQGISSIT